MKKVILILLMLACLSLSSCVTFTGTNEPGIGNVPTEIDADGEALLFLIVVYFCIFGI